VNAESGRDHHGKTESVWNQAGGRPAEVIRMIDARGKRPITRGALRPLFDYLDGLTARATVEELRTRLFDIDVKLDDVAEFVQFSDEQYMRNLIREGRHYHMLAICWKSGQRSPIHNHAQSTCALRVLTGVATETIFERTPSALLKATRSQELRAGDVAVSQDADTHQVSNLESPGTDLVTLHIYSPPLLRMETFTLTDRAVGEFRPMIVEHIHGSGI
jgi:cysteine dioxygenase